MNTIASFFQALGQLSVMESIMVLLPILGTFIAGIALTFMSKHLYTRLAFALLSFGLLIAAPFSANFQVSTLAQTEQARQDAMKYQDSLQKHFNLLTGDAKSRDETVNSRLMAKFNRLDTRQKEVVELLAEVVADANKQLVKRIEQQTENLDDLIADSEGYLSDKISSASVDVIGHTTFADMHAGKGNSQLNRKVSALIRGQTQVLSQTLASLNDKLMRQFKTELNREVARQDGHYQELSQGLARVSAQIQQINRMLAEHQATQALSRVKNKPAPAALLVGQKSAD